MTERFPKLVPLPGQTGPVWTALLEQIFEDAPLPISVLDSRGQVIRENAAQLAFNETDGARLGIGSFNVLEDPRSIEGAHAAQFRKALAFETVEYEFELEDCIRGETVCSTYQRLFVPTGTKNGKPTAVISVLMDITDRKRTEREKERLNAQLLHTHKLESLGVLAGGIAHDFNNLLMGVMGNASIVSSKLELSSPLLKHVQAIEKAARRAADVAQQMLAYAGKGRVERRLVDLSALVSDSSDLLRLSVAGRVELICELAPRLPPVEADVTQLQQVILNLVTNACEAMEGNHGRVRVRTGTTEIDASYLLQCFHGSGVVPGLFAYLEVEDSGHGIDAATLARIFDPFFSTKFEGRGLGLAGVLGIVRGHMGAIRVRSQPGRGTCFRVLLPAKPGAVVSSDEAAQRKPPPATGRRLVLIVDDEELVRETASGMLTELECKVLTANSGREAIEIFRNTDKRIDTVLLDLTMPGLDGTATLRELKSLDPQILVIMMSGYDPVEALTKVRRSERTLFLRKPFSLDDLRSALATLHA